MRQSITARNALLLFFCFPFLAEAAEIQPVARRVEQSPGERFLAETAEQGRYAFILFARHEDAATQAVERTLHSELEKRNQQAAWRKVHVADPAERNLVQRFDVTRTPLPAVMAFAPNGAVTGIFPMSISSQQIDLAILTPRYSELVQVLQQQKLAVLCLYPAGVTTPPQGVSALEADPHFAGRTQRISASADDPAEVLLFERMRVSRNLTTPAVLLFAPPGVHLGTFDAQVTHDQLSKTIHDAGKCGPNCKHHHH